MSIFFLIVGALAIAFGLASWADRGRNPAYYRYRKENGIKWWQL